MRITRNSRQSAITKEKAKNMLYSTKSIEKTEINRKNILLLRINKKYTKRTIYVKQQRIQLPFFTFHTFHLSTIKYFKFIIVNNTKFNIPVQMMLTLFQVNYFPQSLCDGNQFVTIIYYQI